MGLGSRIIGPDSTPAPSGPSLTGLTFWAQRGTYVLGAWADASGNGYNAIGPGGAGNPTVGSLNGRVSPSFTPSQYLGIHGTIAQLLGATANTWSLFVVFSYTGSTAFGDSTDTPILIMHDNGLEPLWGACAGISAGSLKMCGYNFEQTSSFALVPNVTVGGSTSATHYLSSINDSVANYHHVAVDGGSPASLPAQSVVLLTGQTCAIGNDGNPPQGNGIGWQGQIGEVLIYDVALTGADLTQTDAYLASF